MHQLTLGLRPLTAGMTPAGGENFTAVAILGILFTLLGLGMIFDLRGLGERVVDFMVSLGVSFGAENQTRRVAAHKRLFAVGWGALALWFGIGALLIAVLH